MRILRWIRPVAVLALVLLVAGLFIDMVGQAFVCFDICPPDVARARLRVGLETLALGVVASVFVWVLVLIVLARQQRGVGFLLVALIPPALMMGHLLVGSSFAPGPADPSAPASRARPAAVVESGAGRAYARRVLPAHRVRRVCQERQAPIVAVASSRA